MKGVEEYFETDVPPTALDIGGTRTLTFTPSDGGQAKQFQIRWKVYHDGNAGTKYYGFYVPKGFPTYEIVEALTDNYAKVPLTSGIEFNLARPGEEPLETKHLPFSGSILVYVEDVLDPAHVHHLKARAKERGVTLKLRDPEYAAARNEKERPLAFISHDSRDKDKYARPLASALVEAGLPIWYDEYSLELGASLRESIEAGLKDCKRCVLLLSPHFMGNPGWTKREFNAVFTRELIEKQNLIIPVWIDVKREDVFKYSPELVDRVAVRWKRGKKAVIEKLTETLKRLR